MRGPTGDPLRDPGRCIRGFTLLEILVVVVIIGVIVSAATIAVGVLGGDREAEEETRRFWAVLQQAREESELQSMDVALFVSATGYEYLSFDRRRNEWASITYDKLYAPRELPEGLQFRLRLDSREVVLKPDLPDRSDADEHKKWPPQIMVLSSGEVMPFELQIERDKADALWRVVGLPDNDLRVERRESQTARQSVNQGSWVLIEQTKPPPADLDTQRRLSRAR
jgi:general secretion pathway protein H